MRKSVLAPFYTLPLLFFSILDQGEETSAIWAAQLICVVAQVAQAIDTEIPGPGKFPVQRVAGARNPSDELRMFVMLRAGTHQSKRGRSRLGFGN